MSKFDSIRDSQTKQKSVRPRDSRGRLVVRGVTSAVGACLWVGRPSSIAASTGSTG